MDNSLANAVSNVLLDILNDAAGALVDLDPDGKQKLSELRGKIFCLEINAPPVKLYLLPTEHGVEFRRDVDAPADVTLRGSVSAFARLGRSLGAASGAPVESRVAIHGDAELGQALQKILGQLDLDWEELLSRYVGDSAARKLGNAAREVAGWFDTSLDLSRENVADYLREEKRILATNPAVERFDQTVNQTRADVDRLSRRVERIKRALEQNMHDHTHDPNNAQNHRPPRV